MISHVVHFSLIIIMKINIFKARNGTEKAVMHVYLVDKALKHASVGKLS